MNWNGCSSCVQTRTERILLIKDPHSCSKKQLECLCRCHELWAEVLKEREDRANFDT